MSDQPSSVSQAPPRPRTWEVLDAGRPLVATLYGPLRARMIAVGLGNGGLLVVTPGPMSDEARFTALAQWGRPTYLLAPNHFHNAGLASWSARFPEAKVVAHARAIPRLRRQVPGVAFEDLSSLEQALPAGVRLLFPPGARTGETWVSVDTDQGTTWFVTDALVNERKLPGGVSGFVMKVVGFRTGLMTNPAFKRFFLANKAEYKRWALEQLEREQPTRWVPAHGDMLVGPETVSRLREATEAA